uniref:Regucalcin n=1 Tax=Pinctada fucata TaxID=50426 RepID=A0A194ANT4_PINFU
MSVSVAIKNATQTTGEGPHWDDVTQTLLYVDILCNDIHRWDPATGKDEKIHLDDTVGFVVPRRKGGVVAGVGKSLCHVEWDTGKVTKLHEVDQGTKNRFNDGKCDPRGRVWAGTMGYEAQPANPEKEMGSLFRLDLDGSLKACVDKINISNGLAWTEDQKTMYYIDSLPRKVFGFDYNVETGEISNRRAVVDFGGDDTIKTMGYPDGMTIDTEGKLWVACYSVGKVIRFDPKTGETLRTIEFPAMRTTSCIFGGPNLDELYVTCGVFGASDEEKTKYPLSGSVFKVTGLGVKGYPPTVYEG